MSHACVETASPAAEPSCGGLVWPGAGWRRTRGGRGSPGPGTPVEVVQVEAAICLPATSRDLDVDTGAHLIHFFHASNTTYMRHAPCACDRSDLLAAAAGRHARTALTLGGPGERAPKQQTPNPSPSSQRHQCHNPNTEACAQRQLCLARGSSRLTAGLSRSRCRTRRTRWPGTQTHAAGRRRSSHSAGTGS